jgi:NAD(P)-dependent dehydrogenase (short-subunit alcohol dehydrogenase family)
LESKVILVTGASSGLGYAAARYLAQTGHTVYAGARSYQNEQEEAVGRGRLIKVFLDVTDVRGIRCLLEKITASEGRLDVLVNCAACLVLGAAEDLSPEEFELVWRTNLIGTLNMCQGVLPVMRGQRQGKIINFSSLNGLIGIPFESAYVASKFAVEGLSECLSLEVARYNIRVVLVEPTDHRSGSSQYRQHASRADSPDSPYYSDYLRGTRRIASDEESGSRPEGLARLVAGIVRKKRPRLRYTVGRFDQRLAVFLKKVLPGRVFERILHTYYLAGRQSL